VGYPKIYRGKLEWQEVNKYLQITYFLREKRTSDNDAQQLK